ncbi:hypothetical protein EN852_006250 [Mesorhizobium sp. M2E.F.Ca.ET.209.01.1.1]|uniref:hypothetical protein n=1 Tax=Mesorhizobium sp. M2E.F.Ca.ET.209.01.1.1 TaxID=2500526 RepID=UPI000FD8CDD2|nr:hypothetical protein [Mesorhizobium sp. M2E.F.Ca.ET.209.01.1.1]TGS16815.1 hypothetical protein EN852_006250 [Mesorhizobium sp. M2E.F.Ca.ET.209.01.1.1]
MERFLQFGFDAYKLKARDIKRVLALIENVVIAWPHMRVVDLSLLLPLAIAYYKEGDASWSGALANIPDNLMVHVQGDNRYRAYDLNIQNMFPDSSR